MPKVRKEIPELEKLVQVGRKKFVRYEEGAQLYSMGLHTFQELAKEDQYDKKFDYNDERREDYYECKDIKVTLNSDYLDNESIQRLWMNILRISEMNYKK